MATATIQKPPARYYLLWTNPSPSSNFGAQTVQLDLSAYDAVRVMWKRGAANSGYGQALDCAIPSEGCYMLVEWFGSYKVPFSQRSVGASTTGVSFSNCTQKTADSTSAATNNNNDCIPTQIYGIKY